MSNPNPIKVGSFIYSESDIIGKGAFGKVYKGKSLATGAVIAIKVIHVESSKQAMLIKMIKNEVDALKRTKNEFIVQFLDFIVVNNNVHIVTEFCNQKDLKYFLSKHKIIEEKKAVEFIRQIVSAFKELCRQQVIHRDLKPANILLNNGVCKIADFGFAKTLDFSVTDYNTQMVSIVGTPLYMSPQLLDKQKYTTKSDIWSLGIIFYEMLYGRVPWAGKDPATYSKNIRSQPLVVDQTLNKISPDAEDFLRKCLKVSEEERIGWNELFEHPMISEEADLHDSTKENSVDSDYAGFIMPNKRIMGYSKTPANPSNLMRQYQEKILAASKGMMSSHAELTKATLDQMIKNINQVSFTQSGIGKALGHPSKTFNLSVNEDGKNHDTILKSHNDNLGNLGQLKSNVLKDSRELSPSQDYMKIKNFATKLSDEALEEYRKIEVPLVVMKHKLLLLSDLFSTIDQNEEFKECQPLKFNFLLTIATFINMIFKSLSSQVLTKKVKTRSHLLADYLESDSFKRLVVFVETKKKQYDEMLKMSSRRLFELNLPSDKDKDEVLEYYHEVFGEVEDQALLGKIVDMSNQMLYQIRFNSQIYKNSVTARNRYSQSVLPNVSAKEYLEGFLAVFGDDGILDNFKYDKVEEILIKIEKLKEETSQKG